MKQDARSFIPLVKLLSQQRLPASVAVLQGGEPETLGKTKGPGLGCAAHAELMAWSSESLILLLLTLLVPNWSLA